uniref:Venom toxin-like peptide n=1 Tax=Aphidius ervi TaxID=37627 RepID=A0A034WY34_APHER
MKIIYLAWASIFMVLAVLLNGAEAYKGCRRLGSKCHPTLKPCCSALTCKPIDGDNGECVEK